MIDQVPLAIQFPWSGRWKYVSNERKCDFVVKDHNRIAASKEIRIAVHTIWILGHCIEGEDIDGCPLIASGICLSTGHVLNPINTWVPKFSPTLSLTISALDGSVFAISSASSLSRTIKAGMGEESPK